MCCGCWNDDGAPQIDNERVRAVQPLIEAVYNFSCAGGNLHIALDDNNLDDGNLEFCSRRIDGASDPVDQLAAERACCDALMTMTYEERVSALGLWDGCWKLERTE